MTDPFSLGASAAGKVGSAVVASYARGRDERRQAYRRFQEAVVIYVMQIRDSRISPEAMGLAPDQRKPYVDALMQAMSELAKALYEVRLVGNPGPRAAAEALREAISDSFDAAAVRREELTKDEVASYTRAMESFTEECRRDLWYQPPWWQVWRPSWWQTRRHRNTTNRASLRVPVPEDPIREVRTRGDVAFGGQISGIANNAVGTIRIVMGPSVQVNQFHGVIFDSSDQRDALEVQGSAVVEPPAITPPSRAPDSRSEDGDVSQGSTAVTGSEGREDL